MHGKVLGAGLVASAAWCLTVSAAMPSWFDPAEDCALTLGRDPDSRVTVETGWFPPRATCRFEDGQVEDFLPSERTVVLTAVGLFLLVVLVIGLVRWIRSLRSTATPVRATAPQRPRQLAVHLLLTAFLAIGAGYLLVVLLRTATLLGGPPGAIVAAITGVVLLVELGRRVGPGRRGGTRRT